MTDAPPLAPDLFTQTSDGPRLVGGRCRHSGRLVFPLPQGEARRGFEPVPLSPQGRLWSWTVQRFLPKSPPYAGVETQETFQPFVVAYIELPGEIIIESRLVDVEPDALALGQPFALTLVPFATRSGERLSFAFRPAGKG